MSKIRHVDLFPDEVIAGVAGQLDPEEFGVFWMVCCLAYSKGGAVKDDPAWIAGIFKKTNPRTVRAVLERLVGMGKLTRTDGELIANRCRKEIERASKRIRKATENGLKGGRPSKENNELKKPDGFSNEKLTNQLPTTNYQPVATDDGNAAADGARYAFSGKVIRVNAADLDGWRVAFHAIPDLNAELTSIDGWLAGRPAGQRRSWFNAVAGMLNRKHQDLLAKRPAGGKPMPQLSDVMKRGVY